MNHGRDHSEAFLTPHEGEQAGSSMVLSGVYEALESPERAIDRYQDSEITKLGNRTASKSLSSDPFHILQTFFCKSLQEASSAKKSTAAAFAIFV